MKFFTKDFYLSIFCGILSILIFTLFFQLWKVDFSLPLFLYEGDCFINFFIIKNIIDYGWILINPSVGMPNISEIYSINNHPQHSELINLLVVKFFALFSSNSFLIANIFFIYTFFIIALSSFVAIRVLKIRLGRSEFAISAILILGFLFGARHASSLFFNQN